MRHLLLSLCIVPLVSGCTGLALGENDPTTNLGTDLTGGDIAVDPNTETSYVLLVSERLARGLPPTQTLHAIPAGASISESVLDLSGRTDPRLLFVSSGVFVMSQREGQEHFSVLDPQDFHVVKEADASTWFWGTRQSATRRYIAVADNAATLAPINVIDSDTLAVHVFPHGGDQIEAMFGNVDDTLYAISVDSTTHHGRILAWDMATVEARSYALAADGVWSGAKIDITLDDVAFDDAFSFTWVGVAPDDSEVVFPLVKWRADQENGFNIAPEDYELIVLDTRAKTTRTVTGAKGPVGFTPDGATIVSYDATDLLLVDAASLTVDAEPVPIAKGEISFFVSHAGNDVLVASSLGSSELVLVDSATKQQTTLRGPGVALGLDEFVTRTSRDQLFAVDSGNLVDIDLAAASVTDEPLGFTPEHIGILPSHDELVVGANRTRELHFVDPDTLADLRVVHLATE